MNPELEVIGWESASLIPGKLKDTSDPAVIKARSTINITQIPKDSDSTVLGGKKKTKKPPPTTKPNH